MIGIFDSGVGGLMMMDYITKLLPDYNYMYLGDQAHLPYGNKSLSTIRKLTAEHVQTLFDKGAKIVLIACNSATTDALRYLQQEKMPDKKVLGVVIPAVEEALRVSRFGRIGVVGTKATIGSDIYKIELEKYSKELYKPKDKKALPNVEVHQQACPLLVPLIEEEWSDKPETIKILKKYLMPLKNVHVDTLILGCTHYAVLESAFQKIMGANCAIVNSARVQAESFKDYLERHPEIETTLEKGGKRILYTTDDTENFREQCQQWLGTKNIGSIEKI